MHEPDEPSYKSDILVVDDIRENINLLTALLETSGYRVYQASDGNEALELALNKLPDLILLDVRMPGMDGYEVCRQLKASEMTVGIPVIFVSALDEAEDKVLGFSVGGVDYVTKPFQVKEVLARVQTHLTLRNLQRQLETQNSQLQQEIAERKRAELALSKTNEELEERVRERTSALVSANEILNAELQERRRAEDALRKSQSANEALLVQVRKQEEQVREIMNTVPEGVLLLDETGRIIQVNPVAREDLKQLRGLQEGDTIQRLGEKTLSDLLAPLPKGLWHELSMDSRIFEVTAHPTERETENQRWVMVMRDVTREREQQMLSQQQERLAAVGQLAAGIAHDFNNILAVILLYTEMALGMPDLPPRLRERMLTITLQAKRASDLIQQILDFSRRTVLERQPLDLLPFIREQVKLLERTLPENIKIELGYRTGSYIVNVDVTRMQQTIMNLAVNARDAMPDGGKLKFHLSHVAPSETIQCIGCGRVEKGEWICIEVTDTGLGIPKENLRHIFDPFFTTKRQGEGTGLGLSQVYGIIEKHNGHINVVSTPRHGSSFFIYLPVQPVNQIMEGDSETKTYLRGNGQSILVVEDDPTTRQALKEGLGLLNYQVFSTSDGHEALDYLDRFPGSIDLILSDVIMPEMGGIALMHALQDKGFHIPLILMTGHSLQNELDTLMNEGLTAWITKPPRLSALAKLISETLG
jgi:two-component system cell cycle sensor histidine kinase/response regulator CckA